MPLARCGQSGGPRPAFLRWSVPSSLCALRRGLSADERRREGYNIRRGGANFDLACTPAQSEYVALLVGCLAWAKVLLDRREVEVLQRPTTLWAFSDSRLVVELAASSMGGHPRTRSTTHQLATWQHLAPLHEASENIFRELRGMKCATSVQWLSRRSAFIINIDREAKKIAYPSGTVKPPRARRIDQSLFDAYFRAFTVLEAAEPEQREIYWAA